MGYSIFVTYKYSDNQVLALPGVSGITTARNYVDALEKLITSEDHIYKGEDDGESMHSLQDSTIASKLGDKIFYSSVTIILISKGMKNLFLPEKDQWMPWEISYSLKEQSREGRTSKTNAMLAVVVPDQIGSYGHFFTDNPACNSITWNTGNVFQIMRENMFNVKDQETNTRHCNGNKIFQGQASYIHTVKWDDFKSNVNYYIEIANGLKQNMDKYDIVKTIK